MDTNSKTTPKRTTAKDRQRIALDYRMGGKSFQEIGDKLGISRQAAHALVEKALAQLSAETEKSAEKLREIETGRLDTAQNAIWGEVLKGDLLAIDRYLKISARRAALWGMDSPVKSDVTSNGETLNDYASAILRRLGESEPNSAGETQDADA